MSKRILVVESDPLECQRLQRGLENLEAEWRVAYVPKARDALLALDDQPYDVVVAEGRLPDLEGTELLQQVRKQHPKTLRFLRSDSAGRELMLACVWGTHQFIPKPCDPATLVAAIQRGLAFEVWLANENLRALATRLHSLPSLPASYFEVLRQLESPNASLQTVGEAVAKDPALTARLLQTVNSAFFGLTHRVADPTEAVTILGVETAKSVLLCVQVFTHFEGIQAGNLSAESLWKHSLSVAGLCKQITLAETGDRARADEAFTAGLLHDVGKLLLACNLPQDYDLVLETARQSQSPLCQVERQTFGATHEEVGAYVLGLWGLPIPVLEAVGFHHRPQERAGDSFALLTAVHVANSIVHFLHPDGSTLLPATVDLDYLDKLGLQSRQSTWLELAEGKPVELPSPDQFTVRKSSPEGRPADPLPPVSLWWQWVRIPSALSLLVGFTVWVLVHQGRGTVDPEPAAGTAAAQMSQDSQGAAPSVEAEPVHPSPAAPGTPLAGSTNTPPAHPSR